MLATAPEPMIDRVMPRFDAVRREHTICSRLPDLVYEAATSAEPGR